MTHFKNRFSLHRQQAGIVFIETIEQPKPILPVVNFEPFKRTQPIIGLDELGGSGAHIVALGAILHPPRRRERAKDGAGHRSLQVEQIGSGPNFTQLCFELLLLELEGFERFIVNFIKRRIRSSHSSNVAV